MQILWNAVNSLQVIVLPMIRVSFDGLSLSVLSYIKGLARLDFVPGKWIKAIHNFCNLEYVHDSALSLIDIF